MKVNAEVLSKDLAEQVALEAWIMNDSKEPQHILTNGKLTELQQVLCFLRSWL